MNRRDFLKSALAAFAATAIPVATVEKIVAGLSDEQISAGFDIKSFNDLLRAYMPEELLLEQMNNTESLFQRLDKSPGWSGAVIRLPFGDDDG